MSRRLAELAEIVGGAVRGNPDREIDGLGTLESAGERRLSFVTNPRYRRKALASRAGALLVGESLAGLDRDLLVAEDPYYALAQLLEVFHPAEPAATGVHPTAIVGAGAELGPDVLVGPYAVIGEGAVVGAGAAIHAHAVVGRGARVGEGAVLHPHVVIYDGVEVGARSILHSGVVLGCDGFGYATHDGVHNKLRHVGRVVVEDDVEIGANSAVDRSLLDETRIGAGTKMDNLVQIGHNVRVGRDCLLVAQVGIAGSTRLGKGVVMAGQAGAAGHLEIGDGASVAGKSAVFQSVPAGARVAGIPAGDAAAWRRQQAIASRLAEMLRRLRALERRVGGDREEKSSE